MKKSAKVTLVFLSSWAAAVANGCGRDQDGDWVEAKRCVDNNDQVVEDRFCDDPVHGRTSAPHYYRHYYGGSGYYPGDTAYGGSRVPRDGVSYANASRVPRGGFGSTGKAFVSRSGAVSS